jgi:DNA polymerase-3 subunit beta
MEFQVSVDELSKALYRAQGIVEKKSTMPILSSVLIEAKKTPEGGRLKVSAYDLEVGVSGEHPAEVIKEGAVALQAKSLYEIIRSLPENVVVLKKGTNNRVEISSGTAEFKIVGQAAEEFPALPATEQTNFVPIEVTMLLDMIEKTQIAISTDETRYNLNGVFFEPHNDTTRMVATDGHRLCMVEKPLTGKFGLRKGVIIPRKGLMELRRLLLEETAVPGELGFSENSGVFRRQGLVMVMRLIDGQFPDYTQVIPSESDRAIVVPRARLLETLRRVSLIASDKAGAVRLDVTANQLRVSSQNPDLGEAKEDLVIEYAGQPIKIGFNARYILEALGVMDSEQVKIELSDELSPGVIRPVGDKSAVTAFVGVVMPMRI